MVELIAEIGINHNGSVDIAKKLIDVAHSAGVHYVKFQKRDIDTLFTAEELSAPKESPWGTTYREYKEHLEFDWYQYDEIARYCKQKRIEWFASPWDVASVEFLTDFDVPYMKVASACINDFDLLEAIKQTDIPVILSTGMSTWEMVDDAVEALGGAAQIYCIMQCTSTYPSDARELNLKTVPLLKGRYPWAKIGFSNHHPGILGMAIAISYGAEMVEFHTTLDRSMYGSDQAASIEPEGVFKIAKYTKVAKAMMGDGNKKIYDSEIPIIEKLRRTL